MGKKRVLFVDDEKLVLDGLRRALRSMRKIAEMDFATGGHEALEAMAIKPFDVIVCDMRMPGMDGAQLLLKVKKQYPSTIRIILTGQADDSATKRAIHVAHQFLMKPCNPEKLKTILKRACLLHELMTHPFLKSTVSGIDYLPSLPDIYIKIQQILDDPGSSVEDVAVVVEKDIAMSSKLLQLVNSAFFGYFNDVKSPAKAVHLLGIETVKSLVLALKVFSGFEREEIEADFLTYLWNHSFETAIFSREIMKSISNDKTDIENAFVSGLLHDIGKLILASNLQKDYKKAIEIAQKNQVELRKAEFRVFKASHAEVGGYLLGIWGIPGDVVEAVTFHHRSHQYPGKHFTIAATVACADMISHTLQPETCIGSLPILDKKIFANQEVTEKIDMWQQMCRELKEQGDE